MTTLAYTQWALKSEKSAILEKHTAAKKVKKNIIIESFFEI